ncbi:uncharacterized protein BDV14DRAFT_211286 [Aspergillus stella-maris]|uniref:uncharacterized protein n=1 Tax=Aspergillus stella-maris TaxID=1810926 RepID=UPI003CCDA1A1
MAASYILIKGATVLPVSPRNQVLHDHDILIEHSYIKSVAPNLTLPNLSPSTSTTIIDASNCIVTPGFVNGHHHLWQHLLRGLTADWSLFGYACHLRTVYGSLYSPEDVRIANYAAGLSLLNNGVTTVLDHCHVVNSPEHADAAVAGLKEVGIRGTFCYGFYPNPIVPGIPESVADNTFDQAKRLDDALRVRNKYFPDNNLETALLTFGVALDDPTNLTPEQNVQGLRDARKLNPRITTVHASVVSDGEPKPEIVQQLEDASIMGPDLVFSHGVWFTDEEIDAVRRAKAGIIGTPDTEIQMGMGYPIVWKASDARCRCGLGLDITSNQGNDFVAQMRLALQVQRAREYGHGYDQAVQRDLNRKAADVLRMATLGGAEAMQLDSLIGSIEAGKKADLVLWRCDDIETVPILDPVATIVFHSSPKTIDTVLVDGKIIKKNGEFTELDWPSLREQVQNRSGRLRSEAAKIDMAHAESRFQAVFKRAMEEEQ